MLAPATFAALSPFLLGLSQAVVFETRNGSHHLYANATLLRPHLLFNASTAALPEIIDYPCNKHPNPRPCYKKYYEEKHLCHPLDQDCYKDCQDWDDYKRRCEHRNERCYDKCYYEDRDCHRYDNCKKERGHVHHDDGRDHNDRDHDDRHHNDRDHGAVRDHGDDRECYKKHKDYFDHQDHCKSDCSPEDQGCYKCRKECPPWEESCNNDYRPPRYCKPDCKPDDKGCHKCRNLDPPHHHDRECEPKKDKDCFPGYPEHPDWDDEVDDGDDDYHPRHPKSYITVNYFGPGGVGTYQEKVWPDGDEHWNDEHFEDFHVDHIKYYAEHEDSQVRCLPMKSWFPWTPLPVEKYVERTEEYGLVVRILHLKKPIPIELIRCDVP